MNENNLKINETLDKIGVNINEFVKSNVKSAQLEIYERITNLISSGISATIVISMLMLTIFFINLGVAHWLGEVLDNESLAYVIVGGFYFTALVIYLLLRNRVMKNTIKNTILKKVSKTHDEFDNLLAEQEIYHKKVEVSMYEIRDNINAIKNMIQTKNQEETSEKNPEENSFISRALVVTSVDFLFKNIVFKNGGFFKKEILPAITNTFITSKIFGEGKFKSLLKNLKSKSKSSQSKSDD